MANNFKTETPQETQLTKAEGFIIKNKKVISITILAILVIVVGFFCYKKLYSEPNENEASTSIAKAQDYFAQALSMKMQGADADSTGAAQKQVAEAFNTALNGDKAKNLGFLQIIDQYGGTDAANLANLYAGLCYANLGKWQQAQQYLEDYDQSNDAMVSPMAEVALGDVYANEKQLDEAVEAFKKAAEKADKAMKTGHNDAISPIALLKAGQILESQNKKEDALAIYKDIKAKYLNSPIQGQIDAYIERCTK